MTHNLTSNVDSSKLSGGANLEADIAQLTSLLSQDTLDSQGEASVVELLQRLENADGIAKGMESKLDTVLDNLDNLLASLENREGGATQAEPASKAEDLDQVLGA